MYRRIRRPVTRLQVTVASFPSRVLSFILTVSAGADNSSKTVSSMIVPSLWVSSKAYTSRSTLGLFTAETQTGTIFVVLACPWSVLNEAAVFTWLSGFDFRGLDNSSLFPSCSIVGWRFLPLWHVWRTLQFLVKWPVRMHPKHLFSFCMKAFLSWTLCPANFEKSGR